MGAFFNCEISSKVSVRGSCESGSNRRVNHTSSPYEFLSWRNITHSLSLNEAKPPQKNCANLC